MTKQKHAGGRPLDYTPEVLDILADSLILWVEDLSKSKKFGMLKDWCYDNYFNPKYFKHYGDRHPRFKEAYEYAKSYQEHIVCRQALTGSLNARFAQFFLCCAHKWRVKESEDTRYEVLGNDFGRFLDHMDSLKKKDEDPEDD